jgi:hypothetical protein
MSDNKHFSLSRPRVKFLILHRLVDSKRKTNLHNYLLYEIINTIIIEGSFCNICLIMRNIELLLRIIAF